MTIVFQFAFESHLQDSVAAMARQYVRSIVASVQRIALALSSARLVVPHGSGVSHGAPAAGPEAATLARWICQSYRSVVSLSLCTLIEHLACVLDTWIYAAAACLLACAGSISGLSLSNPQTVAAVVKQC